MACTNPLFVFSASVGGMVPVPCNKCPPCKKRRVDSWVFRLQQQDLVSTSAYFVTLTYDDEHVPISANRFMTLDKSDPQKFFKRLRKLCPDAKIKYYLAGEYGSKTMRPHYHAIIFNVPDMQMFADAWSINGIPIGSVHIGSVSNDSIAYCMKYIDKVGYVKKFARDDRVPEFSLKSLGLGANYLTSQNVKYHREDVSRMYITKPGGHIIAMPTYYRRKIYDEQQIADQLHVIQDAMQKKLDADTRAFNEMYGSNEGFNFYDWKSSQIRQQKTLLEVSNKKRNKL